MKRISNFTADRMDMKQMAAISGGAATSETSTICMGGCVCTTTCSDDWYMHPTQGRTLYRYNYQTVCI
jgi:hypothetical protein